MGVLSYERQWQPSKLERSVERMACRRARKQLLGVPWDRFRKAHAAYPRWLAFTLWTKAILATAGGHAPSRFLAILRQRCPDLIDQERLSIEPGLLVPRLQEWIHTKIFRDAEEEGWLDALMFFGVRDVRSRAAWAYAEHCEREWERRRPSSYPSFEEWWQTARNCRFCHEVGAAQIATALAKYVELHAFAYWLRPILEANQDLPAGVAEELERKCPGFLGFHSSVALSRREAKGSAWPRLLEGLEDHCFAQAKKQGWFQTIVQQARNDPRHVRMAEFGKRSRQGWSRNSVTGYPSLDQWRRAVDNYVEKWSN